ncbi:hypothetical protein GCM10027594_05180 [Hymenobacter agri]
MLPYVGLAQHAASIPTADTVYFDQDWSRTSIRQDAHYVRLVRHGSDGKPLGTVRDFYYPSWRKQGEGKLLSETPDVLNGLCVSWHENGQLAVRGTFVQGRPQSDIQQWNEQGKPVTCGWEARDVFTPNSPTTLYARYSPLQSSAMYTVPIPAGLDGLFYALDIRDTKAPLVSLENAVAVSAMFVKAYNGDQAGAMQLAVNKAMERLQTVVIPANLPPTKCRYLITADKKLAQYYTDKKGMIETAGLIENRPSVASIVSIPAGCREFYVCISNDNYQAPALAQLTVKGIVRRCQ